MNYVSFRYSGLFLSIYKKHIGLIYKTSGIPNFLEKIIKNPTALKIHCEYRY